MRWNCCKTSLRRDRSLNLRSNARYAQPRSGRRIRQRRNWRRRWTRRRGRGGGFGGAGTLLYDAIYLASNEVMKPLQGRKAVVVLTDGVDHGSKESIETAIESAQRADTLVIPSFLQGEEQAGVAAVSEALAWAEEAGPEAEEDGPAGAAAAEYPSEERPDGKKVLQRLSQETGAQMFEVSKKESIDEIYARIEEELRHQYSIGYTPEHPESGYHKIHLATKNKDLIVQARDGYYAGLQPTEQPDSSPRGRSRP